MHWGNNEPPEITAVPVVEEPTVVQPPTSTVSTTATRSELHISMYKAALKGDWEAAEILIQKDPNLVRAEITARGDGALHVAAASKHTVFLLQLVELMSENDLLLRNKQGNTAFCCAAESGIVEIASVMRTKNPSVVTMRGRNAMTPLHIAALYGNKNMVMYLYTCTRKIDLSTDEWFDLLIATIRSSMFDVALSILNMNGSLAKIRNQEGTALHHLVQPVLVYTITGKKKLPNFLFPGIRHRLGMESQERGAQLLAEKLWAEIQTLGQDNVVELIDNPVSILHDAAKAGNVEIIDMIASSDPDLLLRVDNNNHTIFHTAVLHRQEKVFNLIHQIGYLKEIIAISVDKDGNNILHLAGKLAPPSRLKVVSGAAYQMEREILWFTEVKKVVPQSYCDMKNNEGWKPIEVFSMEHQLLLEDAEKWMKYASNSWVFIATLIATVAFAAAITLPGGNNNDTGVPLLLKSKWFTVFIVSDVVAMLCATTSMLTFLLIVTSRYYESHFIKRLPSFRLAVFTLEYAVIAMLIAFASSFYLVLHKEKTWIANSIFAITCSVLAYIRASIGSLFAYSRREWMFSQRPFMRERMFSPRLPGRERMFSLCLPARKERTLLMYSLFH